MLFLDMSQDAYIPCMLYNHVIITCHIVYWWTVMFKVNQEFEFVLYKSLLKLTFNQVWNCWLCPAWQKYDGLLINQLINWQD
jgi:hypothetical protein